MMRRAGVGLALLVSMATIASAVPMIRQIRKVAVARLAENIERELRQKPDNVALHLNLARLYAMAYALKVTEFDADGSAPSNGYEPLRALDDNGDGELRGAELRHLAIWRDRNQNGVSEKGEVRPLAEYGIAALACAYEAGDGVDVAAYSLRGVVFADGTTRPTYDVILRSIGRPVTITED